MMPVLYDSLDHLVSRRGLLKTGAAAAAVIATSAYGQPETVVNHTANVPHVGQLDSYRKAGLKGLNWLIDQLREDGSYGANIVDLGSYYKHPWLYLVAGRNDLAYRVLRYIGSTFLRSDGDFTTSAGSKSANETLAEYYPYTNTWITMGAQKLGRFDIAQLAYNYLRSYYHENLGGFTLHAPYKQGDNITGAFITAHLGLAHLYFGDTERAQAAGDYLRRHLDIQRDLAYGLYLRQDDNGSLITNFPPQAGVFHVVETATANQLYFFLGYPIGFLGKLYEATGKSDYLEGARAYHSFARTCNETLYSFLFSHKVAWGAAVLARLSGDPAALDTATRIADYLVSIQHTEGAWLADDNPLNAFDQTAEIALWMLEISAELGLN